MSDVDDRTKIDDEPDADGEDDNGDDNGDGDEGGDDRSVATTRAAPGPGEPDQFGTARLRPMI